VRWRPELGLRLSDPDQVAQRLLRATAHLAAEKQLDEASPPPGREVEVSIETDERAALLRIGQRYVLVVFDAER
jgi:hypothetical protein